MEIDILGRSCDVVKLGNLLKTASIRLPLSVLISRDIAKSLQVLLVKTLKHVKPRSQPSLGRKQKNTLLWPDAGGGQRAWRNKKPVLSPSAVTDEEGHPLENEDESGRRLCEYW